MAVTSKSIRDVAVVTGGGGGIGAACCRELASGGSLVAVLDQNREVARKLADEVGGVAYECDISSEDELIETTKRIELDLGGVRTLVNCAGITQGRASVDELSMHKWDDIVRIDQRGTYLSCIVIARAMLERRSGSIINVASVAGMRSLPLHAYAPAKAAVISMTETLAAEWGASGVRVNAVSPGFTMTERMRAAIGKGIIDDKLLTSTAALHRLVEPSEVAKAIAFLASDNASAITGINLPVDCGWLAGSTWSAYGGLPDCTEMA
jgi:NAD(P)-dependent dehydrogenase (short-subunit alcohol dehydrogenase family)